MAGIRMENKIYEVGMYCRLSKDDGTDNESASIATQKSILTDLSLIHILPLFLL